MCHLKAGHTPSLQDGSGFTLFGRFRGEKQNPLNSNNMLLTETGGQELVANEKHWNTFKNQPFSKRQRSMRVGQLWLIRSFPRCQFDILALRRWRELIFPNILPNSGSQWLHRCRCFAAGRPVLAAQKAPSPIGRRNMLQDTACLQTRESCAELLSSERLAQDVNARSWAWVSCL